MTRTIVYLLRKMFIFFARVLLSFYYREVQVIGIENIPKDGPVIIIANHPNMYLDTLYIPAYLPRHISYLVSASTHRQRLMGFVSKIFGNIPVERPRDISKEGVGQVELFQGGIVKGYSTKFTEQASVGGVLLIKFKIFFEYTILEIKSDTEMTIKIKDEHLFQFNQIKDYKVAPKFGQGHVIEEAKEILGNGECLGVFPEGWSHDLTELLPLKAGVAMIGLGAMLKDKDMKINVVWCGFKYTRQSRFRSRAVVEYGLPFEIDESLVREYELDKKQAWENFLKIVELNLRKVIFSTPSYAEMNSLHLVKRLYIPTSISQNLSIEENNEIHKRLIEGYNKFNDKPEIKELIEEVFEYGKDLKIFGAKDSQWFEVNMNKFYLAKRTLGSILNIIISTTFLLPGMILFGPLYLYLLVVGENARKIDKRSSISNVGAEVVASKRMWNFFIFYPLTCFFNLILIFAFQIMYTNQLMHEIITNWTCFFFFFPIYGYLWVLTSDGITDSYMNLRFSINWWLRKEKVVKLWKRRSELANKVHKVIDKFGPLIYKNFKDDWFVQKILNLSKSHHK